MIKLNKKARLRRAVKIRAKIRNLDVLRLTVHKTNKHIYAQIFSSNGSRVMVCASSLEKKIREKTLKKTKKDVSAIVGDVLAKRALDTGISCVAFDRSGFKFHGRIKALAEAVREAGLKC